MSGNDQELLKQFTGEQSQDAFTALVNRHLSLVYSAALRQVRSPQLAEEVSQSVFAQLARHAATLKPGTILTAWLYQVTRHIAVDVVRREARRQAREQIAFQMSDMNETAGEWNQIEPLLEEAMESLGERDRAAVLLRFFENKSLREVGEALGASEDAAQKRVNRALERLRRFFTKRKVAVSSTLLGALLASHASQAAPAGLAAALSAGAFATASALSSSTAVIAETITMTTLQKTIIGGLIVGGLAIGSYQTVQVARLKDRVHALQQEKQQLSGLNGQVRELQEALDTATGALARASSETGTVKKSPSEVLKLRGEVGRLRQEKAELGSRSALSKVTADADSRKMLRDQQKLGMGMIYKGLAQQLKLGSEQTEKLNELLADHIMENVNNVTLALRDKLTIEQMDKMFGAQEAGLQQSLESLLGPEGVEQYQQYSRDILSRLSAEQFKSKLTGTEAAKDEKANQFRQAMQEEVRTALAEAGLPQDYQAVPMLNFRNIASEQEGERSLKLLETIYQRVANRSQSFLSAEELASFEEFRLAAIRNSRGALTLNRTMMAPISN